MRIPAFIFWLMLTASVAPDAFGISMDLFLESAKEDYALTFQKEKVAFLKSSSSNTPFLNEIEFRTRTDRYDINRQRYTIRLRPNGWGEGRIGKKVYDTTLAYNQSRETLLFNEVLKKRYMLIIGLLHKRRQRRQMQSLMVLYEDKISVLKKSVNNLDFDAGDLIQAEDQAIEIQLDLITVENAISDTEDEIRRVFPVAGKIVFDDIPLADHRLIQERVENIPRTPGEKNIHIKNARLSARLAAERYNLEKVENRRYVRYIEANYDMSEQDRFERAMSLEIGITLPIVNPNRLDINRRKLDSLREKRQYADMKRDIAVDIDKRHEDLKRLMNQYAILTGKKKSSKAKSSLDIYMGVEGADPLILLKFRESMMKTDIALEKISSRIYEKYIDLLDAAGMLIEPPLKNYLSADSGPI